MDLPTGQLMLPKPPKNGSKRKNGVGGCESYSSVLGGFKGAIHARKHLAPEEVLVCNCV